MKKLITTLTAVSFALGLTSAGLAQTTVKEGDKPAVKMETPVGQTQVAPKSEEKSEKKVTPGVKETAKPGEKAKVTGNVPAKAGEKDKGKKMDLKAKDEKKSATPVADPKKEQKK